MEKQNDPEIVPDHDSDPARTPGFGWVGEGGASDLGPATHIRAAHERIEADDEEDDSTRE